MSDRTPIEWTNATWPIVAGCDKVSRGCKNCWAIRDSWRLAHNPAVEDVYGGTVHKVGSQLAWTGLVRELPERLGWPIHWRKPRRIFVCSQSDLFHEKVSDRFIDQAFAVMALCPRHTFQILTKRPERLVRYLEAKDRAKAIGTEQFGLCYSYPDMRVEAYSGPQHLRLPLPNVHLGFSAEDQATFDERWLHMERAAEMGWLVWLSAEPLLGEIRLGKFGGNCLTWLPHGSDDDRERLISWVVAGGESGKGAEPSRPDWFRLLRDQCVAAGVPFLFKQWGVWAPHQGDGVARSEHHMFRVGKKIAGRMLDGRTHTEFPT